MPDEALRSRAARLAAETALVRVIHHYGTRPKFVVLGGLVPDLLCRRSQYQHAGTTDIDVQVNLEVACGSTNTARLEHALREAEFEPDNERVWRWIADGTIPRAVIKFELLADLDDVAAETTIVFDGSKHLGAVNLRGTGFAARDVEIQELRARVEGTDQLVKVKMAGLAGFLLAKCAAARSRRKPKDWYDIAFVLLHNDVGGPEEAALAVLGRFGTDLAAIRSALDDLCANFAVPDAQGPQAYAAQMLQDHPDLDGRVLAADAVVAVDAFDRTLQDRRSSIT